MKRGGVVSSRISQFEELCVPINKSNASIKKTGSMNKDIYNENRPIEHEHEHEHEQMHQTSPMIRYEKPVSQTRSEARQYGVLQNVQVARCEETVVIKNLWNPIEITNLDVGSNYLIEITGDITSLVPGERDITLETRFRTEPSQGNTNFCEVSSIRVCGISHGKLTQFSIRRYLELDNRDGTHRHVQLIADVRSQAENINIKNMFVSITQIQFK